MRAIFQNMAVPFHKKNFFSENFCPVCDSLLVQIWTYKNVDEKEHTFYEAKTYKSGRKTDIV